MVKRKGKVIVIRLRNICYYYKGSMFITKNKDNFNGEVTTDVNEAALFANRRYAKEYLFYLRKKYGGIFDIYLTNI